MTIHVLVLQALLFGMVERINTMLGNDNITDGKAAFEAIHGGNKQAISF